MSFKIENCPECGGGDLYVAVLTCSDYGVQCQRCGFSVMERLVGEGTTPEKRRNLLWAWNNRVFYGYNVCVMETGDNCTIFKMGGHLYSIRERITIPQVKRENQLRYRFWKRKGIVSEMSCDQNDDPCKKFYFWQYRNGSFSKPMLKKPPEYGILDRARKWWSNA